MTESDKDLLGIKPIGNAIEKSIDGLGAFFGKICMPVAEEIGLYFQDRVKLWRAHNAISVAQKAEGLLEKSGGTEGKNAHPLLAWKIIENGSFADTDELQEFWAGLLASSCTDSLDDSNHIFIDILSQLTKIQVKVIEYACKNANIYLSTQGFLQSDDLNVSMDEIWEITGSNDFHRVDRELDMLRNLGLFADSLGGGFHAERNEAYIAPSPLCLQLYARCCGNPDDPAAFYGAEKKSINQIQPTAKGGGNLP